MVQVVDASVAVAWCAQSQATVLTESSLRLAENRGGHVPAQFWFEVLHSVGRLRRAGAITETQIEDFIERLAALSLTIDPARGSLEMAYLYMIARRYGLNIYDAAYLELSLRTGLPLATRDGGLAAAAISAGAKLLES